MPISRRSLFGVRMCSAMGPNRAISGRGVTTTGEADLLGVRLRPLLSALGGANVGPTVVEQLTARAGAPRRFPGLRSCADQRKRQRQPERAAFFAFGVGRGAARPAFMRTLDTRRLPAASGKLIPSLLIVAYTAGGVRERPSADAVGVSPLAWTLFALRQFDSELRL